MQVKKFEASSMKEALEMIKTELGPDAIILAANDNKSFGLMGRGSVQVTAAVSEAQLKKREFARKHLREEQAQKFNSSTARAQKAFIEKSINRFTRDQHQNDLRNMRYADILDDNETAVRRVEAQKGKRVETLINEINEKTKKSYDRASGKQRVQDAVKSALRVANDDFDSSRRSAVQAAPMNQSQSQEVSVLKSELAALKNMLSEMHSAPKGTFSVHPGADRGIPFELSAMYTKLTESGIDPDYTVEILNECRENLGDERLKNKAMIQGWIAKYFLNAIKIADQGYGSKYHVFMGPTAQGKTATLIKYAAHLKIEMKKSVCIMTCDTDRVGGSEQLRILSKILNTPFIAVHREDDWFSILEQTAGFDYVLIDTPSMNLRKSENLSYFREILPPARISMDTHYVIGSQWRRQEAYENLSSYLSLGIKDIIVTKLDEASQHGSIFNLQHRFGLPLHSFGTGPQMPGDFEFATEERVLDLILKITKSTHGGGLANDGGIL